jgi:hypothetical protein
VTDRTPAETLTAAVTRLRERSIGVTAGPWTHNPDLVWNASPHFDQEFVGAPAEYGTVIVAATGKPTDPQALADADWIALMHPAVGLALADWLAHEASYQLHLDETGQDGAEDSTHALAVARAILGEAAE